MVQVTTDEQLVEHIKEGKKEAMGILYSKYYHQVYNKCFSFVKNSDTAHDMAQDIMIKVIEKISSFNGSAKFSTWLFSVATNFCLDYLRKQKRKIQEESLAAHLVLDQFYNGYQDSNEIEYRLDIAEKVYALMSEDDRKILMMKYQGNMSILELQSLYRLSESAMKMRILRARSRACEKYREAISIGIFEGR